MDGRSSARVDQLSKLTLIEQLRERLVEEFGIEPKRQRLFYRGKQVSAVQKKGDGLVAYPFASNFGFNRL